MKDYLNMHIESTIRSIAEKHSLPTIFNDTMNLLFLNTNMMYQKQLFVSPNEYSDIAADFSTLIKMHSPNYPNITQFLEKTIYNEPFKRKRKEMMEGVIFIFYNLKSEKITYAIREMIDSVDRLTNAYWDVFVVKGNAHSCPNMPSGQR